MVVAGVVVEGEEVFRVEDGRLFEAVGLPGFRGKGERACRGVADALLGDGGAAGEPSAG